MKERRHRSREEVRRILDELKESGLPQVEFARSRGLSVSTISYWRRREREAAAERSNGGTQTALPVRLIQSSTTTTDFGISLPSGVRVSVPQGFDRHSLCELLEVLTT